MAHSKSHSRTIPFVPRPLPLMVALALSGATVASAAGPTPRYVGLPITFERNDGQFPAQVLFASRGAAGSLVVRSGDIGVGEAHLRFVGANPAAEIDALAPLVTRSHYYVGKDSRDYITGVPHFGALRLKDVYPGIDVKLHGTEGTLEYDFEVAPGADPRDIRIDLRDLTAARIDEGGSLLMESGGRRLVQHAPVAFQDSGALRAPVEARFEIVEGADGPEARIALGAYDASQPLTVDPVLAYASYAGSSGAETGDMHLDLDGRGSVYYSQSDNSIRTANTCTFTHLDIATNTVMYQTSVGGSGSCVPTALAVGGSGDSNLFVAGYTNSVNFPGVGPASGTDGFVVMLNADGTLGASRLLGGSGSDFPTSIALDAAGDIFVGGYTNSVNFPTTVGGSINNGLGSSGAMDGFVAKLAPNLATTYARYVGGSGDDYIYGVGTNSLGEAVVVGSTSSVAFPQVNARAPLSPSPSPSGGGSRGFAVRLSADGTTVAYSQFVAGASVDARAVVMDPITDDAIIGGRVNGVVTPSTVGSSGGLGDAYVIRLDAVGTPYYGITIGGSGDDGVYALALGSSGDVYAVGTSSSANFPVVSPVSSPTVIGPSAFIARIRDGALDFSTLLGSSGVYATSAATRGVDNEIFAGGNAITSGSTIPTVNPYRASKSGSSDEFIAQITNLQQRRTPAVRIRYDADGDGRSDLIWRNASGAQGLWLMNGTAASGYGSLNGGTGYLAQFVADFNGDGRSDVLYNHPDGSWKMQLLNGTGVIAESTLLAANSGWNIVGTGDFNGDGRADILFRALDGTYAVWLMNGTSFTGAAGIGNPGAGFSVAFIADFDGDGRADLVWTHPDGRAEMWLMNGTTPVAKQPLIAAGTGWRPTAAADLDGDGRSDLIWSHDDGRIGMWIMNGTSVTAYGGIIGARTGWSIALAADLNGDGRQDVILRHVDGRYAGWLMNGTSITAAGLFLGQGTGWALAGAGDFNGDRRADLVWRNVDGTYGVWLMNGLSIVGYGSLLGANSGWELAP